MNEPTRAPGQPLLAMGIVLGGWVCLRLLAQLTGPWNSGAHFGAMNSRPSLPAGWAGDRPARMTDQAAPYRLMPSRLALRGDRAGSRPVAARGRAIPRGGSDHYPVDPAATLPAAVPPDGMPFASSQPSVMSPLPGIRAGRAPQPGPPELSGDAWLLLRAGTGLPAGGGPSYGDSQAGAIVRRQLGRAAGLQVLGYLRGSTALNASARDISAGFGLQPLTGERIAMLAELRLVDTGGARVLRPAIAMVGQAAPRHLPKGLTASGYVQAGWVGGPDPAVYGEAQALLDRSLIQVAGGDLRLGVGAWAAGQSQATRVDIGPTLSLSVPLGPNLRARLQADWRQRIAGNAAPGSGPAMVLSTSF